jgi:hypothetical protein
MIKQIILNAFYSRHLNIMPNEILELVNVLYQFVIVYQTNAGPA